MTINENGIVSASRDELMAIWLFDDDLFRIFDFSKFLIWCKIVGVKVYGCLIDRMALMKNVRCRNKADCEHCDFYTDGDTWCDGSVYGTTIMQTPAVDAVEVDIVRKWLYEIAMNNVGIDFSGDFSDACEEIISRLE